MSAITQRRKAIREILSQDPQPSLSDIPEHLRNELVYSAGESMPGYMPDSEPAFFATEREARGYARSLGSSRDYVAFVDCVPLSDVLA